MMMTTTTTTFTQAIDCDYTVLSLLYTVTVLYTVTYNLHHHCSGKLLACVLATFSRKQLCRPTSRYAEHCVVTNCTNARA